MIIEHSGGKWESLGFAYGEWVKREVPVWPIGEYLARTSHGPAVKTRIERLNPKGKPEGDKPRGWNPKLRSKRRQKKAPRWH